MPEPLIYCPCFCAGVGAMIGLIAEESVKLGCLPVIIGSGVGGGIGCVYCLYHFIDEWNDPDQILTAEPIIIQNMAYSGQGKG
jgi:hypothetical protein